MLNTRRQMFGMLGSLLVAPAIIPIQRLMKLPKRSLDLRYANDGWFSQMDLLDGLGNVIVPNVSIKLDSDGNWRSQWVMDAGRPRMICGARFKGTNLLFNGGAKKLNRGDTLDVRIVVA